MLDSIRFDASMPPFQAIRLGVIMPTVAHKVGYADLSRLQLRVSTYTCTCSLMVLWAALRSRLGRLCRVWSNRFLLVPRHGQASAPIRLSDIVSPSPRL